MTAIGAALLAEILASPDDDASRVVWADEQGGERGELVIVQCDLACGGWSPAESGLRRRRQRELLAQFGREWSGLEGIAKRCRFRRGFVEIAGFDGAKLDEHVDAIFAAAPLLGTIELDEATPQQLERLFEHPRYGSLRGLRLPWLDDAPTAALVERGLFAQLGALELRRLGPLTARALTAARLDLVRFAVFDWGSVEPWPGLFASMPALRALDLTFHREPSKIVSDLPATLEQLQIKAEGLDALAASPLAAKLTGLLIDDVAGSGALPALAACSTLRSLAIRPVSRVNLEPEFVATPLPAVRELRASITLDGTRAVLEALGSQLEQLEVTVSSEDAFEVLRPLATGDFFPNRYVPGGIPLFASQLPTASMFDYPFVHFRQAARP